MRTMNGISLAALLASALACGGGEKKEAAPPPPPKPEPKAAEPPAAEPVGNPEPPPPPDPKEEITLLLGALSQEVANLRQQPFSDWGNAMAGITNRDGDLESMKEKLPEESDRIDRLRKNMAALGKAIEKKNKKQADKALKAFEADLKIEAPKPEE